MPVGDDAPSNFLSTRNMLRVGAMLFLALAAGWLLYSVFSEVRGHNLQQWREQQRALATQITRGLGDFFSHYHDSLAYLANNPHVAQLDQDGREMMARFYHFHRDGISGVSRVDEKGVIVHTVPYNPRAVGADVSGQEHNRLMLKHRAAVVSDIFTSVQGYRAVAYAEPVFDGGEFKGALSLLVPFNKIAGRLFEGVNLGAGGRGWVMSASGKVLYSTGRAPWERSPNPASDRKDLAALGRRMTSGLSGEGNYPVPEEPDWLGRPARIEVVWRTVEVGDTFWTVAIAAPTARILSTMKGFVVRWLSIITVLMAAGLFMAWQMARAWLALAETRKRRAVERELLASNQRLVAILDNLDAAVYVCDLANSEIIFLNRQMKEMHGGREGGKCWRDLYRRKDGPCPDCRNPLLLDDRGLPTGVSVWESKNPVSGRWQRNHAQAVRWLDGRMVRLQISTDIQDLKEAEHAKSRLEGQLRHSQKMEAVGTLAGGVAHDFNNLLQIIDGYLQLLEKEPSLSREGKMMLEVIEGACDRAAELVRQLLTFSRHLEPRLRPLDVNQLTSYTAKLVTRTIPKMISVSIELASDLPSVMGDANQLEQVLLNLAANARDAMPDGGSLVFRTRQVRVGRLAPSSASELPAGQWVEIEVSDTGTGIKEGILENIFEPFFTTKKLGQGTGLGLSTVYGIVKGHGGLIIAGNGARGGAVFRVALPAGDVCDLPEANPEMEAEPAGRGGETILLVDDEAGIVAANREMLTLQGFKVLTASSGEEAIEVFQGQGGRVDLIVLDLGMPGMGGVRCLAELRKLDPGLKVLVASGYLSDQRVDQAMADGARDYLPKPYRFPELLARIRKILACG